MPVPRLTRLPGISPPHCGLFEILLLFVAEASGHIDLTFLAAPRPLPCGAQAASLRRTSRFLAALRRHRFSRGTQTPPFLCGTQTPPLLSRHSDATVSLASLRRHRFSRVTQAASLAALRPPLRHSDVTPWGLVSAFTLGQGRLGLWPPFYSGTRRTLVGATCS